jgi:hypothetical protein
MIHWLKWTNLLRRTGILVCLLFPILLLVWTGCEKEPTSSEASPTPRITEWELPAKMAYNSPKTERIMVTVEDAQGPQDVPSVLGTILSDGTTIDTFSLWDDGSYYSVAVDSPWVGSISGDVVPGDGIFTRRITGQFVDQVTTVSFRFEATDLDGHSAQPVDVTVEVRANSAPVLEDPLLPDTLVSGFDPVTLSVRATDPDDLDSLVRVWLEVVGSGKDDIELSGPDANNRWSVAIDRSFAAGIIGEFPFNFYGEDTFQDIGGPVGQVVTVENNPPVIWDLVAPDTMVLPTQAVGTDTAELFLTIEDDQTLADIYAVYFTSVFNDTVPNPTVFYLFDDGLGADQVAGDGIYSQGIVLAWDNRPGKYTFTFVAQDLVEQESDPIVHDMWVVPSPVLQGSPGMSRRTPITLSGERACNPFHLERRLP